MAQGKTDLPANLKLIYFTPGDIQMARVDRQCIVYFCEALHNLGIQIELVTLGIELMDVEKKAANPLDLYRLEHYFQVTTIPTSLRQQSDRGWISQRLCSHSVYAWKLLKATGRQQRLIFYIKNYSSALIFWLLRRRLPGQPGRHNPLILFEAHLPPKNTLQRFVLPRMDGVVANTEALADDMQKVYPKLPVIGTHQGVNLVAYNRLRISKFKARKKLGLPTDQKLVVYTGKIYWGYPEVDYLLQAAKAAPDIHFLLVGGREDHAQRFRQRVVEEGSANVQFAGFVPPNAVQDYQLAADALLLYYPSGMELNQYRSPGKLFEYMASGRPVVVADYPVLREVLNRDMAVFVPPDAPLLLARAVQELLLDPQRAERIGQLALQRASDFTWEVRARKILDFIAQIDQ